MLLLAFLVPVQALAHLVAGVQGRAHVHVAAPARVARAHPHSNEHSHSHVTVQRHVHAVEAADVAYVGVDAGALAAVPGKQLSFGSDLSLIPVFPAWRRVDRLAPVAVSAAWAFLPHDSMPAERPPR